MPYRFEELAESVTDGLKADRELRLDVQRELTAHLEETAAVQMTEGATEEEATEHAVQVFGNPLDVAGRLVTANQRRMKLRALARVWLGTVLVPVAVLLAVIVASNNSVTLLSGFEMVFARNSDELQQMEHGLFLTPATRRAVRQVAQVQAQNTPLAYRAQWTAHPDDPKAAMYYGAYASRLHPHYGERMSRRSSEHNLIPMPDGATFESEMRLGEQIDPDNALYNYYLAYHYLNQAVHLRVVDPKNADAATRPEHLADELLDHDALARGLAEFQRGLAKPRLDTYGQELLRERLDLLPSVYTTLGFVSRSKLVADSDISEFALLSILSATSDHVGAGMRLLARQNNEDDLAPLLQAHATLFAQAVQSGDRVILLALARGMNRKLGQHAAEAYELMGQPEAAESVRARIEAYDQPLREAFAAVKQDDPPLDSRNIMAFVLVPVFPCVEGNLPAQDYMPLRHHQSMVALRTALYKWISLYILVGMLLFPMVVQCLVTWVNTRKDAGNRARLLLLPWRTTMNILFAGVLLPTLITIAVLLLCDRMLQAASSLFYTIIILIMYGSAVAAWPWYLSVKALRRRCNQLGIQVPESTELQRFPGMFGGITVFSLALLCVSVFLDTSTPGLSVLAFCCAVVAVAWFIYFIAPIRKGSFKTGITNNPLLNATLMRSLLPVYACVLLVLTGLVLPTVQAMENYWLRQDTTLIAPDGTLMPAEQRRLQEARDTLFERFPELAPHPPGEHETLREGARQP